MRASCDALRTHLESHHHEPLYVGGASRLAAEQDAFTATTIARVTETVKVPVLAGGRAAALAEHDLGADAVAPDARSAGDLLDSLLRPSDA